MTTPLGFKDKEAFIWKIADDLRGSFKAHEYGSVILPFVVLRRLECALEGTKEKVIAKHKSLEGKIKDLESILCKESAHSFYNTSPLDLDKILRDPNKIASNLNQYIRSFSPSATEVLDKYGFPEKIKRLDDDNLLFHIVGKFADLDLSEDTVSNEAMGYIFEELLRKFSEMSNETAGEHYTPREVIRLMVNLLFIEDEKALAGQKPIRSIYDPACGTGGMLSIAEEHLHELNPNIQLNVFGQELNAETWAIARSDLMIKGQDPKRITQGNSLNHEDGHAGVQFDYLISNPPYGVDWKKYEKDITDEHEKLGFKGRYGAGLPRVSDGSFLFIQHMISKMKPYNPKTKEGGSRIAIILSGSPLYSGDAGSGESEIRKWVIENDLLEGIVAMPDQMFYNTGIGTYIWIITNRKDEKIKGLVKLVDGRELGVRLRKALGEKRKELSPEAIAKITQLYVESSTVNNTKYHQLKYIEEFGFAKVTIERPLRRIWIVNDETITYVPIELREILTKISNKTFHTLHEAEQAILELGIDKKKIKSILKVIASTDDNVDPVKGKNGDFEPDSKLRDTANITLPRDFIKLSENEKGDVLKKLANDYLADEISPYFSDAWIDHSKTKIGYEIPFARYFFTYVPPRASKEIKDELKGLLNEVVEISGDML